MYQALMRRFFGNTDRAQTSIITLALSIQLIGAILVISAGYVNGKIVTNAVLLAILLAVNWFLVREAKAYEADASKGDLEYIKNLMMNGNTANLAKLVAKVVPELFDRIFGSTSTSRRSIWRSCVATTILCVILMLIRHPSPWHLGTFYTHSVYNWVFVLSMYIFNWISLVKERFLLDRILRNHTLAAILGFVVIDGAVSYLLPLALLIIISFTPLSPMYGVPGHIQFYVEGFVRLIPIKQYLYHSGQDIHLITAMPLTPLLTSVWTTIMIVSSGMLLYSVKYLERFIAWWFPEVEKSPLKAIAIIAGSLMVAVAIGMELRT
jgi:hypothetical protein